MANCSSLLPEKELRCSLCLDVFKQPVSLPCGDTFCKRCITEYWDRTSLCRCPECYEQFVKKQRPKLIINTTIKEKADNFRRLRDTKKETPAMKEFVTCDVCTGTTKHKAIKSCLECLTSYCQDHVEPHQRVSGLKRHTLIDPVENLEDRMCKKHDKPLDRFCKTDDTLVCYLCVKTGHKAHRIVSLEVESVEKRLQLAKVCLIINFMFHQIGRKREEIFLSVQQARSDVCNTLKTLHDIEASLVRSLEKLDETIIDKELGWVNVAAEELSQTSDDLENRITRMGNLASTEDHLHFLLHFPSLSETPHVKEWPDINTDLYKRKFREALRSLVAEAVEDARRRLTVLEEKFNKDTETESPERQEVHGTLDTWKVKESTWLIIRGMFCLMLLAVLAYCHYDISM